MDSLANRLRDAFPDWLPPSRRPARGAAASPPAPAKPDKPEAGAAPAVSAGRKLNRLACLARPWRLVRRPRRRAAGYGAAWIYGLALSAGISLAGGGAAGSAEAWRDLTVDSRQFQITVDPRNEISRNARAADLYVASSPDAPWIRVGECAPVLRGGALFFERGLRAPRDGVYYFTSSAAADEEGTPRPPPAGEAPQARVVVDTTPPRVEWLRPPESFEIRPGDRLILRWRAVDDNFAGAPLTLSVAVGEPEIWLRLPDRLPSEGVKAMVVPADWPPGPATFLLTAADRAGHRGFAQLKGRIAAAPPAPAPRPEDTLHAPFSANPSEARATASTPPPAAPDGGDVAVASQDDISAPERKEMAVAEEVGGAESLPPDLPPRRRSAWVSYISACNLVRQDRLGDALRYFREAVDSDPGFVAAWGDFALAYKELGAFTPAREALAEALRRDPENPALLRLRGEIEHAEGMERHAAAADGRGRQAAREKIDLAIQYYSAALDAARRGWKLAEQAPTYYRLGEICYYVNHDPAGARAYWRKILDLHATAPDPEPLLHTADEQEFRYEQARYERHSFNRATLDDWQTWARRLLLELDADERRGVIVASPVSSDPTRGRGDVFAAGSDSGAAGGAQTANHRPLPGDIPAVGGGGALASRGLSGSGSPLAAPGMAYGLVEDSRPGGRHFPGDVAGNAVLDPRYALPESAAAARGAGRGDGPPVFMEPDAPRRSYPPTMAMATHAPGAAPVPRPRRPAGADNYADWPGLTPAGRSPDWASAGYGSRP